jgi:hypothetical protein
MTSRLESNTENAGWRAIESPKPESYPDFVYSGPPPAPERLKKPLAIERAAKISFITLVAASILGTCVAVSYQYRNETDDLIAARSMQIERVTSDVAALGARLGVVEVGASTQEQTQRNEGLRAAKNELRLQGFDTAIAMLTERFDQLRNETSARDDNIVSRLEKLEQMLAARVAVAAPTPTLPPDPQAASHFSGVRVSNEVTGSIEGSQHVLSGFTIRQIQNGVALIKGPGGQRSFSQGQIIPGAGLVQKVERRGYDWIVVTSLGIIRTAWKPHVRLHRVR